MPLTNPVDRDIERCRQEIADIEAQILADHPDLQGLCLALSDWWAELHMVEGAGKGDAATPLSPIAGTGGGELPCAQTTRMA